MKKLLLLSALATSGLVQAADAIPDVVKHFSEQQNITIIKKLDAPGGAPAWLGQYQDMGIRSVRTASSSGQRRSRGSRRARSS